MSRMMDEYEREVDKAWPRTSLLDNKVQLCYKGKDGTTDHYMYGALHSIENLGDRMVIKIVQTVIVKPDQIMSFDVIKNRPVL